MHFSTNDWLMHLEESFLPGARRAAGACDGKDPILMSEQADTKQAKLCKSWWSKSQNKCDYLPYMI